MEPSSWTLDELSRRVERSLQQLGSAIGQANGQVSEVPNARTIRYYTTVGLLDRPRPVGRTASYGLRHLEQLIAIKRLQAQGLTLAQVQERLIGLGDEQLKALAALPEEDAASPMSLEPRVVEQSRRERTFWSDEPAAPARPVAVPRRGRPAEEIAGHVQPSRLLAGLQLPGGVSLAFPAARAVHEDDLEALREALRPLVDTLRARGLIARAPEGEEP